MTMHLLGPQYSTTNTRNRKQKLSDSKFTKWASDWRADCKRCKRLGIAAKTLDEYVAYRQGKYKPTLKGTPMPKLTVSDHRQKYPSSGDLVGHMPAKPTQQYSGEGKLLGIATMHKSNLVPVFSRDAAEDIARMRR